MDNLPKTLETVGNTWKRHDRRLEMFVNTVIFGSVGVITFVLILIGKRL